MAASAGAVDKCVDTLIKLKSTDTCYNGQNYYTWASRISDTLESYGLAEVLTDDTRKELVDSAREDILAEAVGNADSQLGQALRQAQNAARVGHQPELDFGQGEFGGV